MVVPEEFRDKVNGLLGDEVLILRRDELLPRLLAVPPEDAVEVGVKLEVIGVEVLVEFLCSKHLGYLD